MFFPKHEPANKGFFTIRIGLWPRGARDSRCGLPSPFSGPRTARIHNPKKSPPGGPLPVAVARCPLPISSDRFPDAVAQLPQRLVVASMRSNNFFFAPSTWLQTAWPQARANETMSTMPKKNLLRHPLGRQLLVASGVWRKVDCVLCIASCVVCIV